MRHFEPDLVSLCETYPYARTNFLSAAAGGSFQRRRKELGLLFNEGKLRRHNPTGDGDQTNSYPLNWHRIYSPPAIKNKMNWHAVGVADLMLSITADAKAKNIPMLHKIQILGDKPLSLPATISHTFGKKTETCTLRVQPDALCSLGDFYYAVEFIRYSESIEAGTFENTKSCLRSFLQYRDIMKTRAYETWGIPNLKVLFVFDNAERMKHALQLLEKLKLHPHSFIFYCFPQLTDTAIFPVPITDILNIAGIRAGHPAWYLNPNRKEVS